MADASVYERRIINRLAATDPQMSTALGTPIRKIIEAVSYEMSQFDIDVATTSTLYSVNSVSGVELDYLVGQFGFTRQEARYARGEVTIRRDNADSAMTIPYGTRFSKPATATSQEVVFQSTAFQTMAAGVTSATIPVICSVSGSIGNVAADSVVVAPAVSSYVSVTNASPMSGGRDAESDDTLRRRFVETVFRNVSSTRDQYVGLTMSHADVTRGIVIGRVSRYSEVAQVSVTITDGAATSAVAEIDEERYDLDVASVIDVDYRTWVSLADGTGQLSRNQFSFDPASKTVSFAVEAGSVVISPMTNGNPSKIDAAVSSITSVTVDGEAIQPAGGSAGVAGYTWSCDGKQTEVTITYPEGEHPPFSAVIEYETFPLASGDLVNVNFDYLSKHARDNDRSVDIYADGRRPELVDDILYVDVSKVVQADGYPATRWQRPDGANPVAGHVIVPLGYQPLTTDLGVINIGSGITLASGSGYFPLYDVSSGVSGSTRSCDAVELVGSVVDGSFVPEGVTGGASIGDGTPFVYRHYYDAAVSDLQKLIDQQSVLTCDPLVHEANRRLFEVNLTIMLSTFSREAVEQQVDQAVTDWFSERPLGGVIQLSDIETVVAMVQGVDSVRVTTQQDEPDSYGIVEYQRDGVTAIGDPFTSDIPMSEVDAPVVIGVNCFIRSQKTWG